MNNITTENKTQTPPSLESLYALFVNPIAVVRFYQIGFPITFLLGFAGNLASLITFSRVSLRKVSTSWLFIVLAIADSLVLCIYILDFVEFGLQIHFYKKIKFDEICRFRSFISDVFQVLSSWILVLISLDRWIRARFPYKSPSFCTPKNALLLVGILLILSVGLHAHLLTSVYGMLIPDFSVLSCGPTIYNGSYFYFYFFNWSIIKIVILCLLPAILMSILLVDTVACIHIRKRVATRSNEPTREAKRLHHQKHVQTQMFILMLTSIIIFLVTILPSSIYKITAARQSDMSAAVFTIASIWTAFQWVQSLNYALHFYSHCLTSTLFRKEFLKQIQSFLGNRKVRVNTVNLTITKLDTHEQAH